MRIKRDYLGAVRRFFAWLFSRFKPLTIHTEAIVLDSVWEKIKKEVKKGKVLKWYVMTPANHNYFKSEFNIQYTKERLSKILKERYKWMLENNQELELHIHLSMIIDNMSYKEQENLFKHALTWMEKEIGIKPKEFVPGWWAYNQDTIQICGKNELKMIKERDYDYIHDYNL